MGYGDKKMEMTKESLILPGDIVVCDLGEHRYGTAILRDGTALGWVSYAGSRESELRVQFDAFIKRVTFAQINSTFRNGIKITHVDSYHATVQNSEE